MIRIPIRNLNAVGSSSPKVGLGHLNVGHSWGWLNEWQAKKAIFPRWREVDMTDMQCNLYMVNEAILLGG